MVTEDGEMAILKRGVSNKHQNWTFNFINDKEVNIKLTNYKDKYLCAEGGRVKVLTLQSSTLADTWFLQ